MVRIPKGRVGDRRSRAMGGSVPNRSVWLVCVTVGQRTSEPDSVHFRGELDLSPSELLLTGTATKHALRWSIDRHRD
jgi:hypothetical protein